MITQRRKLGEVMKAFGLPMIAAEIGVAEGRYSLEMLEWGLEKLYLVDLWAHVDDMPGSSLCQPQEIHDAKYRDCMAAIKPYANRIVVLRGWSSLMSRRVPDNSLGLVYIDATHRGQYPKQDIELYYPKLVGGGVMAGHDYLNPNYSIKPVADEFAARVGAELHVLPETTIENASFYFLKPQG